MTTRKVHPRWRPLFDVIPVARERVDDRDLLDRKVGDDLDLILVDDEHLLDAYPIAEFLAVLRLQREGHALLDLDRMIERPDARDDRGVVLREAQAMAPEVGGRLILVLVAPGFHGRRPLHGNLARGGAGFDGPDRVVEPSERRRISVLLLLAR